MKRFVVTSVADLRSISAASMAFLITVAAALSVRAAEVPRLKPMPVLHPVLLGAPSDLPDVAQCHGILSQAIVDLVNGTDEDPAETFEKNRRAHPHMIMLPPHL